MIYLVLIVAKCIVNSILIGDRTNSKFSINSSKVYCKFQGFSVSYIQHIRINSSKVYCKSYLSNTKFILNSGINSSKVYCKY